MNRACSAGVLARLCVLIMASCSIAEVSQGKTEYSIVGGVSAMGRYSPVVALVRNGSLHCSATLLSENFVLTAAHCLSPEVVGEDILYIGIGDSVDDMDVEHLPSVTAVYLHPNYIHGSVTGGLAHGYDIGVAYIAEGVQPMAEYGVLPWHSFESAEQIALGEKLDIVGYGITSIANMDSGIKRFGLADLVGLEIHEMLISSPGEQQSCYGDSGGPAFYDFGGGRRVVGITSRSPVPGILCNQGAVNTRVDVYVPWIASVTGLQPPGEQPPHDAGSYEDAYIPVSPDAGAWEVLPSSNEAVLVTPVETQWNYYLAGGSCSASSAHNGGFVGWFISFVLVIVSLVRRGTAKQGECLVRAPETRASTIGLSRCDAAG